ncbi:MAG: ubiquitin-like small modifier protein 1 [Candidatus Hodarchaeota archaeon]
MDVEKIRVTVRFFADFREIIKRKEVFLDIDKEANILELLENLCKDYDLKEKIFDGENNLKKLVNILKNGRQIKFLNGLKTKLSQGDEISLFPPAIGG